MTIGLKLCVFLAAWLVLSACANQKFSHSDAAGLYALVSVNGNQVPASVSHEGATLQVVSGTFTINADWTCNSKMIFLPPSGTESTREVSATYTKEGSTLTMQWDNSRDDCRQHLHHEKRRNGVCLQKVNETG